MRLDLRKTRSHAGRPGAQADVSASGDVALLSSSFHLLESRDAFAELDWSYSNTVTNGFGSGTRNRDGDEEQGESFHLSVLGTRTVDSFGSVTKNEDYDYDLDGYVDSLIWTSASTAIFGGTESKSTIDDSYLVWEYDAAKANLGKPVEVHAFQRLADGLTMIAESGPARIIEVDRTGKVHREVKLQVDHPSAHSDTRLVRKLANGNYLVAHEADGRVREYDAHGKIDWQFDLPLFGQERKGGHGPEAFGNSVFSATRLANGNTLIGAGNGHCVLEVDRAGKIVWKVTQHDLPGITLAWVTRVERLPNGNTLIGNCHAGPDNPQLIEVTPERKVVWTWKDFTQFGNSTPVVAVLPSREK